MSDLAGFLMQRIADTEHTSDLWAREAGVDPTGWLTAMLRRECGATRRIVEMHREGPTGSDGTYCVSCLGSHFPCHTLRATAYVYADDPDFRREWA
jgi:Family of unknown function (DUF6221)